MVATLRSAPSRSPRRRRTCGPPDVDARPCGQERAISRYAAWSRHGRQAAEPSAAFTELDERELDGRELDERELEEPESDEELDEPEPDEPEPDEPEPDEPLPAAVDAVEPESPELLAAGTDEEEPLRESVR
jgi:hypothetical protein